MSRTGAHQWRGVIEEYRDWLPLPEGTPTRLILIRHGSTQHNLEKRFSGRNELPLNAAGERRSSAKSSSAEGRTVVSNGRTAAADGLNAAQSSGAERPVPR